MAEAAKIALVTGAGSGIGRETATAFLMAGWKVVLTGRREAPLQETVALAEAEEGDALVVPADVADPESVDALFAKIEEVYGRLDLLFNNAGANTPGAPIDEIPVAEWKKVVDINLTGSFLCARGAFALMRRQKPQGGRIINNGSISAYAPRPGSVPYTASKHAISGLTKTLALDGRPFDIACGQIDIGNAGTDMAAAQAKGVPQANGSIAVEPLMDTREVADAVLHMASLPLSSNILFMTVMATKMPFVGRG
ncbi:SDR family oxidoreductase [Afifella marina]|uniref:NADP-dependent 3-hydroxy acid dehydrogenase YdfG n=1 Tax=Afifella marina DSM 2698 TaxID=1120955 RepID=A0A1G5MHU0_AFIMA|nr:SDR family oxidoreductase [Afifella marina]MBK1623739.1 NAD(P)-dependent oxidoreductase [Afifella marina DSM 2698]MBK1627345.1 NAD(P)-dependent oxidoreductase [Afifella marina]MBK5918625.1 3-oxoacyl-ACP reductase [Afifella marina]RAI22750.1 3-oxoacyl-ACP reductase [Afifella marina DSM 2698]SCZ24682.1 NADP-dependent 3-hydroxy acid dehydrogenase YdfG [Afifella marina DSM 2698]